MSLESCAVRLYPRLVRVARGLGGGGAGLGRAVLRGGAAAAGRARRALPAAAVGQPARRGALRSVAQCTMLTSLPSKYKGFNNYYSLNSIIGK